MGYGLFSYCVIGIVLLAVVLLGYWVLSSIWVFVVLWCAGLVLVCCAMRYGVLLHVD